MGKAKGNHRLDKEQDLQQLESKYNFLESAHSILDLCAAPGGCTQVAVQRVPVGSFVLGIDLFPIRPIRGAVSVAEDITISKCRATIKRLMAENGCRAVDVVLHDVSPNVDGAWAQEATSQASLVIDSVKLATEFLSPKGTLVTKVCRSQDYNAVLYCLKQLFDKVEVTKPAASRSASAEIYVVGLYYEAPAKIDPRLLDMKHLLNLATERTKVLDVLPDTKQMRHRYGYEEGNTTLREVCSASDFVWSETPLDILGTVSSISLDDPACLSIKDHERTNDEIKALCDDLRVLGKKDLKQLRKWRVHVRKSLSPTEKAVSKAAVEKDENKVDEDEKILNEMEEMAYAVERRKKRATKLLAKRQTKGKAHRSTGMQIDAPEDGYGDHELFSLSAIKGKKDLEVVDSAKFDDESGNYGDSENENSHQLGGEVDSTSEVDTDEEQQRYDDLLEGFLDEAYERFVTIKEGSSKQRKHAKRAYDGKELYEGDDIVHSDNESENEIVESEANPLIVPLHEEEVQTQDQITEKLFSQDIFAEAADNNQDLGKRDTGDEMEDIKDKKLSVPEKLKEKINKKSESNLSRNKKQSKDAEEDFEIVPALATDSRSDSSSSSDESEEEDNYTKAGILGTAKKMLRKKQMEQLLDDGRKRYIFDDGVSTQMVSGRGKEILATNKACYTKAEIIAMQAKLKEIHERPRDRVFHAIGQLQVDNLRRFNEGPRKDKAGLKGKASKKLRVSA